MKKTSSGYIKGKNTKEVTKVPNFFLKLMGKIDARKGEDIAMAHIERYLQKCISIEDDECLLSEEFLKRVRTEGAVNLDIITNSPKNISVMPKASEELRPWETLQNRRRTDRIAAAKSRLYEINEEIINGKSILEQRIAKIRKKAASKISVYVKGVREGGIPSFNPNIHFSDEVVDKYYKKHTRDNAIAAVAAVSEEGEV